MFSLRLKEARIAKGLTLKSLGSQIGMAESTVSLYEAGKREPDLGTVQKLSIALNVSTDYLLGRTNDRLNQSATRETSDEDIKFALSGGLKNMTNAQYEEVKRYARYIMELGENDK